MPQQRHDKATNLPGVPQKFRTLPTAVGKHLHPGHVYSQQPAPSALPGPWLPVQVKSKGSQKSV
eukprot:1158437-Pelagomonas_calceolata.AAC.1